MKTLKQLALLPLFFGLVLTTACSENYDNGNGTDNGYYNGDDNGNGDRPFNRTITAVVENGNNYNDLISKVAIRIWADGIHHTIATGTWANGGFTTTLPETVSTEFLLTLRYNISQDVNISDASARVAETIINAYDEQQRDRGRVAYGTADLRSQMILLYVDRDVTITGADPHFDDTNDEQIPNGRYTIWNLQLRAGWNRIYFIVKDEQTNYVSTEPISGLRWHFHYYGAEN